MSWRPPSANSSGRYLIASGTADYDFLPENAQLSQVPRAIEQIVNLFTQHLGYTRVLADELGSGGINPNVEELRQELAAWFGAPERSPEDLVTVYYTGHGASEVGRHYLYGRDTREVGSLAGFALRSDDLADFIAASPVQHVLVLLDTCYSGAGAGEAAARAQELSRSLRVDEQRGSGLLFVASARPKDEAEQLVFAEALYEVVLYDDSVAGSLVQYLHPDEVVDGINRLFERRGLQQRARLNAANVSRPAGLLPNPRYFSGRHMVQVWNPVKNAQVGDAYAEHDRAVTAVAVKQINGNLIAASGGYDAKVLIWDVATRSPIGDPINLGGTVPLGGVAFGEIGHRPIIVTAADSRSPSIAQAWDLMDRTPIGEAVMLDGAFGAVATMQLGNQFLIVFSDYDGVIRVRSFTDRSLDTDLHCHQPSWSRAVFAIMFNGEPTLMAGSHEGGMIDIWNLRSRSHEQVDIGSSILALTANPRQEIAVGTTDGITLIHVRGGQR